LFSLQAESKQNSSGTTQQKACVDTTFYQYEGDFVNLPVFWTEKIAFASIEKIVQALGAEGMAALREQTGNHIGLRRVHLLTNAAG
jgi:hypothetical protein